MVGVERAYPQGSQYQDREGPRDGGLGQKQPMMKEPLSRDYRQVRSYSNMDYETEWDSFHRQSRYSGDQKMPPRENRRSMSPISAHRHSGMESGRPFEGNTARYPYPSDRQDQYSREEMDRLPPRPFRHDDKMVASPLPREDQPGYFEQAGRSNSYRAPTTNYGIPQHRGQEPLPRHADGSHESARRERHSIDMPLASPTTPVGAPPPKRSMSTATIATR
ncbi:hypothetical protein BGZ99_007053 [Dissophora globulifera]|uniref:Uncharacterized protein n=1 Tax=Dissophora globulifera TaxID=979702 RepID=A0A9P6UQ89_9FUNG|nr:hypothetical protein BGZ99_007053 [Dissophora globulifera]